jgi:hypothetical protein
VVVKLLAYRKIQTIEGSKEQFKAAAVIITSLILGMLLGGFLAQQSIPLFQSQIELFSTYDNPLTPPGFIIEDSFYVLIAFWGMLYFTFSIVFHFLIKKKNIIISVPKKKRE